MTSLLTSPALPKGHDVAYTQYTGPSYTAVDTKIYPIPFLVNNGILDINIDNQYVDDLINVDSTHYLATSVVTAYRVKMMGGLKQVSSLSANTVQFLSHIIETYGPGEPAVPSNIRVYTPCVMTKIQISKSLSTWPSVTGNAGTGFSNTPPSSDSFVTGTFQNNYLTAWVFKTPLVVEFMQDGIKGYFTLNGTFDS
jgi:hypothetical protein